MSSINYSIIIPHKNSPELLQRCLNSIPEREDVQVIVVDDNSSPEKVDFSNFPLRPHSSVEVYLTKEGRGAGYARNVGLQHAKGKWLLFADADDYYSDNFLNVLDEHLNSKDDIIYFSVFSDANNNHNRAFEIQQRYDRYFNDTLELKYFKFMIWAPWNKMFKREFIVGNNIQFEEIPVGNDAFFSLLACDKTDNITVLNNALYCITYNEHSITYSNEKSFTKQLDYLSVNLRIYRFLKKHSILYCSVSFGYLYRTLGCKYFFYYLWNIHKQDSLLIQLYVYLMAKYRGESIFLMSK